MRKALDVLVYEPGCVAAGADRECGESSQARLFAALAQLEDVGRVQLVDVIPEAVYSFPRKWVGGAVYLLASEGGGLVSWMNRPFCVEDVVVHVARVAETLAGGNPQVLVDAVKARAPWALSPLAKLGSDSALFEFALECAFGLFETELSTPRIAEFACWLRMTREPLLSAARSDAWCLLEGPAILERWLSGAGEVARFSMGERGGLILLPGCARLLLELLAASAGYVRAAEVVAELGDSAVWPLRRCALDVLAEPLVDGRNYPWAHRLLEAGIGAAEGGVPVRPGRRVASEDRMYFLWFEALAGVGDVERAMEFARGMLVHDSSGSVRSQLVRAAARAQSWWCVTRLINL